MVCEWSRYIVYSIVVRVEWPIPYSLLCVRCRGCGMLDQYQRSYLAGSMYKKVVANLATGQQDLSL